jgi:hypothetical protein
MITLELNGSTIRLEIAVGWPRDYPNRKLIATIPSFIWWIIKTLLTAVLVEMLAGHRALSTTQRYIEADAEAQKRVVDLV